MTKTLSPRKLLRLGLFANIIEWYEFSIYGYLSTVIGQLFFKETTAFLALIQAFALFAIRFLARPIGGLFFGYFADQHGHKRSLSISLMMMSIPTILIGCLPTYQTIGYWSTGLLLILGLVQGFAAGGEFPVSACYVFEKSPPRYRSLLCCAVAMGNVIGFLSGSAIVVLLFWCFDRQTIIDWAWRIPFLLGIPITFWIVKIRSSLPEPDYSTAINVNPAAMVWETQKKPLLIGIGLGAFVPVVGAQFLSLWMPFYLNHFLKYPEAMCHYLNTLGIFSSILFSFLAAYLTRFIQWQTLIKISALLILVLAYPLMICLQNASWVTLLTILLIFKLLISLTGGVIIEVLGSLFIQARSLGMSICYSLPAAVFGGTTPLICTVMTDKWGLSFPAFYCMAFALMALIATMQIPVTASSR